MNIIKDKKILLAEVGLLFVAMFWGMGFVAGKYVLADMGPFDVMAYRYGFAFIVMFLCAIRHLKAIDKKTLKAGALIGTMMFIGNTLQTIGLQYTTPGKQTFIICMYTVIVPLLSWLIFKEKAPKNICIAAVIAFIGIGLLTLQDDLSIGFGDGLTFLFAISFSMHVILVGRFMKDMDPMAFALVQIGVCAVWSIMTCIFFGEGANVMDLSMPGVLGLMQLVFLNTVFAFILQNTCQQIAPANHTAILLSTETVFGTFFAVTLAGEVFHGRMFIGCVLMFVAIIVSNIPLKGGKKDEI